MTNPTLNAINHPLTDVNDVSMLTNELGLNNVNSTSQNENVVRYMNIRNNLPSGTMTIVIERYKPLILKLRNPQRSYFGFGSEIKPQDDIERMVDELGNELVAYVIETVNSIRIEVKQARPDKGDENYEMKMSTYLELVNYITNVMKTLTNIFTDALTEFRQFIDQLWEDIQRSQNENEIQEHIQQFERKTEKTFQDALSKNIEPLFAVMETKMNVSK